MHIKKRNVLFFIFLHKMHKKLLLFMLLFCKFIVKGKLGSDYERIGEVAYDIKSDFTEYD